VFGRIAGGLIFLAWASAMSWLVVHDLWPAWTAQTPPQVIRRTFLDDPANRNLQSAVFDDSGHVGTIWTKYDIAQGTILREDLIWIERLGPSLPGLRINLSSTYTPKGELDAMEVRLKIENNPISIRLEGERFPTDFVFTLETGAGPMQSFKVPLAGHSMITEALNPFTTLTGLSVGQTWRMDVVNPISIFFHLANRTIPVVVKVTGKERIATNFGVKDCFVVESPHVKAWVDDQGVVQHQQVLLPTGATLRIIRERFNQSSYEDALRRGLFRK